MRRSRAPLIFISSIVWLMLVVALFLVFLLFARSAAAQQVTLPLSLSIGDFGSYGYESPYSEIGAGIEWRSRRVMIETSASYSPTAKLDAGDGYSLSGRGAVLVRPYRVLTIGGGYSVTQIRNSKWSKSAQRPFVTVGLDNGQWRFAVTRELRGHDPNSLEGWSVLGRLHISKNVRIGAELFSSSFSDQAGQPEAATGALFHMDYVFGKRK